MFVKKFTCEKKTHKSVYVFEIMPKMTHKSVYVRRNPSMFAQFAHFVSL